MAEPINYNISKETSHTLWRMTVMPRRLRGRFQPGKRNKKEKTFFMYKIYLERLRELMDTTFDHQ
jgi:hypothetical protein